MARWRAEAAARDVPDADLREKLTDALEALDDIAGIVDLDGGILFYRADAVYDAVCAVEERAAQAEKDRDEADSAAAAAESRLEEQLQKDRTDELDELRTERDEALARLAKVEPLIESYSDLLARARTFVDQAKGSGVPVKHVRPAARRKAVANAPG